MHRKEQIYFENGFLRDIYVHNTNMQDWKTWIEWVNIKYFEEFHDAETDINTDNIVTL